MKVSQRKAMFAQKRSGLNKVTVKTLDKKTGIPLYQINVNGKASTYPTKDIPHAKEILARTIKDAKYYDKRDIKINQ